MSDNGIELIIVNGTDAWLFTFATNALKKISTLSADFTVTIASPAVFSTVAAHGLVAGDAIQLTTTSGSNSTSGVLTASTSSPIAAPNYVVAAITSPDSQNVYIATNNGNGYIYQYLRDSITGDLAPLSPAYVGAPAGTTVFCIEMSPDGLYLYAGTFDAIYVFARNGTNGQLTYLSTTSFANGFSLTLKLSSDGLSMYSYVKTLPYATLVAVIKQFSVNIGTGALTALSPDTVPATLDTIYSSAISTNAGTTQTLYVLSPSTNLIQCYTRTVATGLLTAIASVATGAGAVSIIVSHDNAHVYVSCINSIKHYTRNTGTGVITLSDTLTTVNNPSQLVISADDTCVYASSPDGVVMEFDRNTTTGVLTAMSTPTVPAAGTINAIAITANGKSVYAMSYGPVGASFTYMFQRQQSSSNVGLPTGLDTLTTYYVIATGLTATNFEVSLTVGGTAVNTSGVQAGVHTFHTLGNGFPNGAKTVSYIDGRFVVCQPNTQNFYVSNVLQGGTWDALNVQTADSNPDMIVGQITLHNELIVFCEQSGETFYDSGTYPSPFVRNVSGIFEVGCIAPYSIAKIDNSVMWLGKSNTGQGVIYRLNGYTPVRLSTYAIEYAIQTMTTISDAIAFTYQQEGHHFYVITFPTGNRTFSFDVNTGLWHERAAWSGTAFSKWVAGEYAFFDGKHLVTDTTAGNIYSLSLDTFLDGANAKKWVRSFRAPPSEMKRVIHNKLTLEAEVGVGTGTSSTTGVVNSIAIANAGTSTKSLAFTNGTLPASDTAWAVAHNGATYCAISQNGNTAASTDGINWTVGSTLTVGTSVPPVISAIGSTFVAVYATTTTTTSYTSTNGTAWAAHAGVLPAVGAGGVLRRMGIFNGALYIPIPAAGGTLYIYSTLDGITWTQKLLTAYSAGVGPIITNGTNSISVVAWGGFGNAVFNSANGASWTSATSIAGIAYPAGCYGNGKFLAFNGSNTIATSTDGINWTTATLPVSASWNCAWYDSTLGLYYITVGNTTTALLSSDGINWVATPVQAGVGVSLNGIASNGTNFCVVPASVNVSASATYGYPLAGTYALTFTGGTPSVAATGTYTISATTGQISAVTVTSGGTGYLTTPAVSFPSGGLTGALGSANMTWTTNYNPTGIEPMVSLRYSNDGGHTWSQDGWRSVSLGANGQYAKRVYWYRLGMTTGQTRLYEISGVSATKNVLISAYLE
jgi:hypothetical protein